MSNVAYVKVFLSWVDETRKLKDAEKGRLIDAMVAYAMGDTDIDSRLTGNEAYVFPIFQARLDRDMAEFHNRSKANSQNGRKGGAPLGNSNAKSSQDKPTQAKTSETSEGGKEKEKEKEKDKEEEYKEEAPKGAKKKFIPPTLDEVVAYCRERNSPVDPKRFYDYFAVSGWVDGQGQPVRNWKQKLITWEGRKRDGHTVITVARDPARDWGNIQGIPLD